MKDFHASPYSSQSSELPSPKGEGLKERRLKLFELDNFKLRTLAKSLRKNSTPEERLLWEHLRAGKLCGYKFRRQFPIDKYILDFFCYQRLLAIELDGYHHQNIEYLEYDRVRKIYLEDFDIKVIRFWNSEVNNEISKVLGSIIKVLEH